MEGMSVDGKGGSQPNNQQLFCLRWNNYQSNLLNVFDQLLQNELFVDVTLSCAQGQSLKAHKIVLSACSPYFQSLFSETPNKHPIVVLKDIKWKEMKHVIDFMYKGEINVSQEQIGPLLKVAESLKVRGLADVNGEQDLPEAKAAATSSPSATPTAAAAAADSASASASPPRKRRKPSDDKGSCSDGSSSGHSPRRLLEATATPPSPAMAPPPAPPPPPRSAPQSPPNFTSHSPSCGNMLPPPPPPSCDDMEIKPGIAEMIREEERAKMLESSQAWLNSSNTSLASDSYQYQLQSMWQKCWNTNQSLVHNLRFRERGPLKSWRPETMADAILSVLKEGLSLSQAARKYDIPYPTFVLYANRVHNMLGPSMDGGSDLRPKGRGRPQRILLGLWREDHIQNVIRAVVFRDPQHIKDEPLNLGYHRLSCFQEPLAIYGNSMNSPEQPGSPNSPTAAVVAMAQNLRQQMMAAAAAAHNSASDHQNYNFFSPSCSNGPSNHLLVATPLHSPGSTPPTSPITNNNCEANLSVSGHIFKQENVNEALYQHRADILFHDEVDMRSTSAEQAKSLHMMLEQRSD